MNKVSNPDEILIATAATLLHLSVEQTIAFAGRCGITPRRVPRKGVPEGLPYISQNELAIMHDALRAIQPNTITNYTKISQPDQTMISLGTVSALSIRSNQSIDEMLNLYRIVPMKAANNRFYVKIIDAKHMTEAYDMKCREELESLTEDMV